MPEMREVAISSEGEECVHNWTSEGWGSTGAVCLTKPNVKWFTCRSFCSKRWPVLVCHQKKKKKDGKIEIILLPSPCPNHATLPKRNVKLHVFPGRFTQRNRLVAVLHGRFVAIGQCYWPSTKLMRMCCCWIDCRLWT